MKKNKKKQLAGFGDADYFHAVEQRYNELPELQKSQTGKVLLVYICGVVVECILRGHIAKGIKQSEDNTFDSRHDLKHLFQSALKTGTRKLVNGKEINDALDILQRRWKNNLRYYSERKFKNEILENKSISRNKIVKSYDNYINEIFSATQVLYSKLKDN